MLKQSPAVKKRHPQGDAAAGRCWVGSGGFLPRASGMGTGVWLGEGEHGGEDSSPPAVPLSPQLAVSVGNTRFNEIMEATLPAQDCPKPSAGSDM